MTRSVYIRNAAQISVQKPLSDEWMTNPAIPTNRHNRFNAPDTKQYISASTARRFSKFLRYAIVSAKHCVPAEERSSLDGIFAGTGLGLIESTENFLVSMIENNETNLSPTSFMQSTHNTIASQIAIDFHCRGYNATFSHKSISFDSALLNAFIKFELGEFNSALVCGVDEMTEKEFMLYDQIGIWKKSVPTVDEFKQADSQGTIAGENCVSILLESQRSPRSLCKIIDIQILHKPSDEKLKTALSSMFSKAEICGADIDGIITGNNADDANDAEYDHICDIAHLASPRIIFKHLFGESYTMSAMGLYIGAVCLSKGIVPAHLSIEGKDILSPKTLLLINQSQKTDYSFTLLQSC